MAQDTLSGMRIQERRFLTAIEVAHADSMYPMVDGQKRGGAAYVWGRLSRAAAIDPIVIWRTSAL
ncbi:hypothetical protein AA098_15850 [Pseudomonas sp. JY-Q]|nr:hypothetical protein AA098_15850 [Pseudomonas sp. JY-Q]